jgi:hypothetical protein
MEAFRIAEENADGEVKCAVGGHDCGNCGLGANGSCRIYDTFSTIYTARMLDWPRDGKKKMRHRRFFIGCFGG